MTNSGTVRHVSFVPSSRDKKCGDRVESNGPHAEVVGVPHNLCTGIPENVSNEEVGFTLIAAIGLQGIRLVQPTLGEAFVVIGLGLIDLLTVQILLVNGCQVLGFDNTHALRPSLARFLGR